MIEATCTACGTVNRIADADVPVGAKFVTCASCKARVAIASTSAAAGLDVADLPAPRRGSAAPRAGLPASSSTPELPVPRTKKSSGGTPTSTGPIELDDLLAGPADGGTDLPAPRHASQRTFSDLPAPKPKSDAQRPGGARAVTDLPFGAADEATPLADLPAPKPKAAAISDLPAPRSKQPQAAKVPTIPPVATKPGIVDLPSPKPRSSGVADLPTPKQDAGDLPSAKPRATELADLPSPKQRAPGTSPTAKPAGIIDLPAPRAEISDLPAPKPGQPGDLPAPLGFFDDLPQPSRGGRPQQPPTDVAPKGFFDDLPQPVRGQEASTDGAPKGFFEDLPQPARGGAQANEVAPKGFFDDLPGRPNVQKPGDVAPKGFFDDLPGRPTAPKPTDVAPKGFFDDLPGRPTAPKPPTDVVAKGFFDDLPGGPRTPNAPKPTGGGAEGFFDDLPAAARTQRSAPPESAGFFDDLPKPSAARELELDALDLEAPDAAPELGGELDIQLADELPGRAKPVAATPAPGPSNQFDDLDLSAPSAVSFAKGTSGAIPPNPSGVATITASSARAASAVSTRSTLASLSAKPSDVALELEEPRPVPSTTSKLGPQERAEVRRAKEADAKHKAAKRRKLTAVAVVAALALGGGGLFAYRHYAHEAAQAQMISDQLSLARAAIATSQWSKASIAANKTVELAGRHAEALGIKAESLFALGIVEGNNPARFGQARKSLADALEAGLAHPALDRGTALSPLAAGQPEKAIPKLVALATRAPKDGSLQLYLGWAQSAHGDFDAAIKSFDSAVEIAAVNTHALFGRAGAKEAKGDLEGARADYEALLEVQKDNIAAQVGLAATQPAEQAKQQEDDLMAILALKDVDKKDPRATLRAWNFAAELARKRGALDVARERYRKAIALAPANTEALTGLADVELRDNKLDVAQEMIDKALKAAPSDLRAALVAVEVAIAKKQFDIATSKLDALAKRTPPPPVVDQARMKSLEARLLMAQGKEQDAIDAYLEAAKLAGAQDLTPTLVAARVMTELADRATKANDSARASELRKKADELLAALSDAAMKDPRLALTLGMAYLEAGDPTKSETWLRQCLEMQPKNVDAMYQLAKALLAQAKEAEAISNLRNAVELDPTRSEIGLELARTYEHASPPRLDDAEKLYDKLIGAKEPTLELRARAGRFFARVGQMQKAGEQGAKILELQEDHPAGLYLKGEGLFHANKTDAARKLFVQASDADPEPQYLDARGRAAERWAAESGNTSYQDDALRSFGRAVERDPQLFSAWLGQGRLYVVRQEDAKALEPLQKAWQIKQTAEVARLLGIALKNVKNQPQNAAGWLEKAYEMEPTADAAFHLGELYTDPRLNNPKAAIRSYERATSLARRGEKDGKPVPAWLAQALYDLGDIHRTQNNLKGAKDAWEQWLQRNPKPGPRLKEVQQMMVTTLKDL